MSWSKRILIDSALLLAILFLPWYVPAILGLLYYWKYEAIEILFGAFIMDLLYTSYAFGDIWIFPMLTCTYITALLMVVLQIFKQKIRFYS
jgi:hypothetical protein